MKNRFLVSSTVFACLSLFCIRSASAQTAAVYLEGWSNYGSLTPVAFITLSPANTPIYAPVTKTSIPGDGGLSGNATVALFNQTSSPISIVGSPSGPSFKIRAFGKIDDPDSSANSSISLGSLTKASGSAPSDTNLDPWVYNQAFQVFFTPTTIQPNQFVRSLGTWSATAIGP